MIEFQVSINAAHIAIAILIILLCVITISLIVIAAKLTNLYYIKSTVYNIDRELGDFNDRFRVLAVKTERFIENNEKE